jgi:CBS domain-containing protein
MTVTGTVKDVLRQKRPELWTIAIDASVYEAVELMSEQNVGALLVEDRGLLLGVISERDYARKVVLLGRSSKSTKVRDILPEALVVVAPSMSIVDCMQLMTLREVRHVPVVEAERIVGLVSMGDLVRWVISEQEFAIDRLEEYIRGVYPA